MKVERTRFDNHDGVEVRTAEFSLIAVADCGPRIAFLGRTGGANLLLWEPGKYTRGDWDLRGGHRVWSTTPLADECENTYRPDNQPCELRIEKGKCTLLGAEDPISRTRRGFSVEPMNDNLFKIDNFIVNTSDMLCAGGVWALTCTLPTAGCRYAVPVGDGSSWDTFTMVFFRQWAGHGAHSFEDGQIRVGKDQVTIEPAGLENKRMLQAHKGIIAMSDAQNDLTFGKKTVYDRNARYPLGANLAFYVGTDNFMVEMETMGPERTLKPGEELHHVEWWSLTDGAKPLQSARESEALFV